MTNYQLLVSSYHLQIPNHYFHFHRLNSGATTNSLLPAE